MITFLFCRSQRIFGTSLNFISNAFNKVYNFLQIKNLNTADLFIILLSMQAITEFCLPQEKEKCMSESPKRKFSTKIIPNIYQINLFALSPMVSMRTIIKKWRLMTWEQFYWKHNISTTMWDNKVSKLNTNIEKKFKLTQKFANLITLQETYSEPCQTSKMECFVKITNCFQPLTIFGKCFI